MSARALALYDRERTRLIWYTYHPKYDPPALGPVSDRPWFHDHEWTRHAIALPEVVPLRCRRLYFAFLWPLRCFLDKGHEGPCHF